MIGVGYAITRRRRPGVPPPTLALNFIANPVIPPGWTFTRASAGSYYGADGLLHSAAPDVARFDANPLTLQSAGLLLETARTNLLRYSAYRTGWSQNGQLSRTEGIAAPDGSTTATEFTTDTDSSGLYTTATVQANVSYVASSYVRHVVAGSVGHSVEVGYDGNTEGWVRLDLLTRAVLGKGTAVSASGYDQLANGWLRVWVAYNSLTKTSVTDVLYGTASYTFDGWGAVLEQGPYPSRPILTDGASATRAADILTTHNLAWLNSDAGTFLIDAMLYSVAGGGAFAFSLDDGASNGIGIYKANGSGALNAYSGGATSTATGKTVADGERFCAGITYSTRGASAAASVNGGTPIAIIASGPVNPVALSIGSARGGAFNSHMLVRSLKYLPQRLSNADLSILTRVS